jgi:hypothetical protein
MARQEGKGSLLFKLIIAILIVILIIVIKIPGKIWSEEMNTMITSWSNMTSVYTAHSYYYKMNKSYTTNISELIQTIENDSSLNKRIKIVNYTKRLKSLIDKFLNENVISNLLTISLNIQNINDDLEQNKMYFKRHPEIHAESEELELELFKLHSGGDNNNFKNLVVALDSLWQLRRSIPDQTLQNAARKANILAQKIITNIPDIPFNLLASEWQSISGSIENFLKKVSSTNIVTVTSVVNRITDFQKEVTDGFNKLKKINIQQNLDQEIVITDEIGKTYQDFLNDFLITEYLAQFTLSENDSILTHLSEDNFYTPNSQKPYTVIFQDTLGLTVEDPTLFTELKERCIAESNNLMKLAFLPAFNRYMEKINATRNYALTIKDKYKRNLDVRMTIIELDSAISSLKRSLAINSYIQLKRFIEEVPNYKLFSQIQEQIEPTLASIGNFNQIYKENIYGALDTVHIDIIRILKQFNGILAEIKNNTDSFNSNIEELNLSLSQIKAIPSSNIVPLLEISEEQLEKIFMFVSNGIDKSVYLVFHRRIINLGKVYGKVGQKSWEEPGSIQYKYYRNTIQHLKNISK